MKEFSEFIFTVALPVFYISRCIKLHFRICRNVRKNKGKYTGNFMPGLYPFFKGICFYSVSIKLKLSLLSLYAVALRFVLMKMSKEFQPVHIAYFVEYGKAKIKFP